MIDLAAALLTIAVCAPVAWLGFGIMQMAHINRVNRRKGDE